MRKIRLILLLYLFISQLYAETVWDEYKIRAIHNQEQLPGKQIKQILQDSKGYMWFATVNGLCRFNGYTLKTYKSSNQSPRLLQSNIVNTIIEDIDHRIWIGTEQGLNILDTSTEKIETISNDSIPNFYIHSFLLTRDSTLWIGTQSGLLRYNRETHNFTSFRNRPNDMESICGNTIRAMLEDKSGDIWIATYGNGICRLQVKTGKFIHYPTITPLERTNYLLQDPDLNLWICTWGDGLVKMENREDHLHPVYTKFHTNTDYECVIRSLQQLPGGDLLVGTSQGMYLLDPAGSLIPNNKHENPLYAQVLNDEINNLYTDKDKNIWIATQNSGVYIAYREKVPFTNFPVNSIKDSGQALKVNALYEWTENELLLGTDKVCFAFYNKKTRQITNYRDIPQYDRLFKRWPGNIQLIFKHPYKNELWLGSQFGGLITCQLENNRIISSTYHFHQLGNTPIGTTVNAVVMDKDSTIWIGSDEGLNIISAKNDTLSYSTYNRIQTICQDHTGAIWLGTYFDGVYRLQTGYDIRKLSFEIYNNTNKLINGNEIICIYEDSHKNLWVGTKGFGLQKYNREKNWFEPAPNLKDIPGDIISNITEVNGELILGTNKGLVLYNISTFQSILLDDTDGMLDNTCVMNAVLHTENGEIYYGTPKGFYIFRPHQIEYDSTAVKTVINDFKIFHKSFDDLPARKQEQLAGKYHPLYSKQITLTSSDNNIGIEFAALSYVHPEKNRYAYKLEGFDNTWVYTDAAQRTAYYTNLPAGDYRFHVRSINDSGIESTRDEVFYIEVLPPIYQTGYAYAFYLILITGMIYLFYRFQLYRFRLNEAVKIEQIERVKSEELNQSKFRFFTNISHEFLTPLSIISCSFEEIKRAFTIESQTLKAVESNVFRLNKLIEEILDFQKVENNKLKLKITYGDIASFISGICRENFSLLVKNRNICLDLHCEPEHIAAWFDRDKIDMILYNLLSNAVKFSYTDGRGKIEVILLAEDTLNEYQYKSLTIRIRNYGKGITKDKLPYIFTRFYESNYKQSGPKGNGIGLALTKSLVELHNGTVGVESEPDEWTEFTIRIPISKEAYTEDQLEEPKEEPILATSPETSSDPIQPEEETNKRNTLLLIEDDLELRTSLQHLLSKKYKVTLSSNGLEGLETATKINPNLIISDVMMPKMDGFELCKKIKENVNTSHIPIILLTAKINGEDQLAGLKCGADSYITKPFNYTILEVQVENMLSNRRRMAEKFRTNPLTQDIQLSVSSYEEKFLEKAIQVVKENIGNPDFDVQILTDQMQVSNSMLYRKLKTLTTLSPNEFIRNIRLKAAAGLLLEKKGNISDIAYLVGFNDPRYFSICFKKEFNVSPKDYMEQPISEDTLP